MRRSKAKEVSQDSDRRGWGGTARSGKTDDREVAVTVRDPRGDESPSRRRRTPGEDLFFVRLKQKFYLQSTS